MRLTLVELQELAKQAYPLPWVDSGGGFMNSEDSTFTAACVNMIFPVLEENENLKAELAALKNDYQTGYRDGAADAADTVCKYNIILAQPQIKMVAEAIRKMADRIAPMGKP